MTSAAAKREEIQLKLQLLRERREREQAAFDALAAAHPALSATEIAALAHQQAEEAAPRCLVVDGKEISIGDTVTVKDDVHLLHRADRGYFGPDVLKPIYCGERAEVVRVIESFQGKPAMELRFADGVAKVFFTECIETDAGNGGRAGGATAAATRTANASHVDPAEVPVFVPPTTAAQPSPKAETLPGWSQLSMPHRKPADGGACTAAWPVALPPPPPPTVAAIRTGQPTTGVAKAKNDASAGAAAAAAAPRQMPQMNAARGKASQPTAPAVAAAATGKGAPAKARQTLPSAAREAAAPTAPSSSSLSAAPVANPPSAAAASAARNDDDDIGGLRSSSLQVEKGGVPQAAASTKAADEGEQEREDVVNATDHQLPRACATTYQAKYELQDGTSRIPRHPSISTPTSGTRTCWVCGLVAADAPLSEPVRVAFQSQCTTMFSLFAVLTRKLQWDKQQRTASRLFTEQGKEVKTASAVQDGMRLVATAGCAYQPGPDADAFRSVPEARPSLDVPPRSTASAKKSQAPAASSPPKNTPTTPQRRSAPTAAAAASPKQKSAPLSLSAASAPNKPRHIRVYENGLYDDNIYRTVTVRPTYRTLVALKTTITRELQWRDGKKVDLLFDACGAEISDLNEISDGDVVVASAGDRFVIPFPNTPMHLEAMKLSERLDPSRRC
ncbi:hypothetical protein ABB37_04862 [Leptomonas pyrrhocoris]|uniref:Doublecortin domain-containing protein n=1 Tax=Leptomonas pyrrhocoris TaxID=157538 RepID=A0A0M9G265_LEPPY|nr:hypothetical protein ABB37_04862 [Leptomonas pyrrhocoris]XP_015659126.1 hypothetical protein ABB37_04862 [Leptomonas pyrrhocoris]KPA80686.1 hypothetical protein ABB37_04862 [Leptomonas pyrrhocoris]KPA80687.1 hypothetical protein ABB37_04862 [Leptomonas pyrrhocoris]|eukprot:XP_015659125.1 hypothetical protein ABB37_04862 [Leptomonas pyrrhocoris]